MLCGMYSQCQQSVHQSQETECRRGRRQGIKLHAAPTDLSEALDPREHASGFTRGSKEDGNNLLTLPSHPGKGIYHSSYVMSSCLRERGEGTCKRTTTGCQVVNILALSCCAGFVLLPSALSEEKQRQLIVAALTEYPEPPTNTNHTRPDRAEPFEMLTSSSLHSFLTLACLTFMQNGQNDTERVTAGMHLAYG